MDYEDNFYDYHQDDSDTAEMWEENQVFLDNDGQDEASEDENLTDAEFKQVCTVNASTYATVCEILGFDSGREELPWDMEWIGELSDLIVGFICERFHKDEKEIYPYLER